MMQRTLYPKTLNDDRLEIVGDRWLTWRDDQPQHAHRSPSELLELAHDRLAANLRYAPSAKGVDLLCEVPCSARLGSMDDCLTRLRSQLRRGRSATSAESPPADLVETALAESGMPWTRRDASWAVGGGLGLISVEARPGELRCEVALVRWDEPQPGEVRDALAKLLFTAQSRLPLLRGHITDQAAWIQSSAECDPLELHLAHSLDAVTAAHRLLVVEAEALLCPDLASCYLQRNCANVTCN